MLFKSLPAQWTPEIINSLNLLQFSLLIDEFGLGQVIERLGYTGFLDYWEARRPGTSLAEFLRAGKQAQQKARADIGR